jgi:hypothetical protein
MKTMKKIIVKYLSQMIADSIIKKLEKCKNSKKFDRYYSMGMKLNDYCVNKHEIYLN